MSTTPFDRSVFLKNLVNDANKRKLNSFLALFDQSQKRELTNDEKERYQKLLDELNQLPTIKLFVEDLISSSKNDKATASTQKTSNVVSIEEEPTEADLRAQEAQIAIAVQQQKDFEARTLAHAQDIAKNHAQGQAQQQANAKAQAEAQAKEQAEKLRGLEQNVAQAKDVLVKAEEKLKEREKAFETYKSTNPNYQSDKVAELESDKNFAIAEVQAAQRNLDFAIQNLEAAKAQQQKATTSQQPATATAAAAAATASQQPAAAVTAPAQLSTNQSKPPVAKNEVIKLTLKENGKDSDFSYKISSQPNSKNPKEIVTKVTATNVPKSDEALATYAENMINKLLDGNTPTEKNPVMLTGAEKDKALLSAMYAALKARGIDDKCISNQTTGNVDFTTDYAARKALAETAFQATQATSKASSAQPTQAAASPAQAAASPAQAAASPAQAAASPTQAAASPTQAAASPAQAAASPAQAAASPAQAAAQPVQDSQAPQAAQNPASEFRQQVNRARSLSAPPPVVNEEKDHPHP